MKVPGEGADVQGNSIDFADKSGKEIRLMLSQSPYELTGLSLGNTASQLDIFVNKMGEDDLVVVPDGSTIYFAKIMESYRHVDRCHVPSCCEKVREDEDRASSVHEELTKRIAELCSDYEFQHKRKVSWLRSIPREKLSSGLRKQLMNFRQIGDLTEYYAEIEAKSKGKVFTTEDKTIRMSYPLRPDFSVDFSLPADLTEGEARRLAQVIESTFYVKDSGS